jgi:NO-binding membrane sensor protein with MHYT domain
MPNIFNFVISHLESSELYAGNYDPLLVALSIGVAIFAYYTMLLVSGGG